jgi:hypothetical protein
MPKMRPWVGLACTGALLIEAEAFSISHARGPFPDRIASRSSRLSSTEPMIHGAILGRVGLASHRTLQCNLDPLGPNRSSKENALPSRIIRAGNLATRSRDVSLCCTSQSRSEVERFLEDARVRRVAAWVLVALGCFASREFYGVIVGTFIMAFIGNSFVSLLEQQAALLHTFTQERTSWKLPRPSRKALSILYFFCVLNLISFATIFTVPQLISSWRYLKQVIISDNPYVELAESIHALIGTDATARLESLLTGVMGTFTPTLRFKYVCVFNQCVCASSAKIAG